MAYINKTGLAEVTTKLKTYIDNAVGGSEPVIDEYTNYIESKAIFSLSKYCRSLSIDYIASIRVNNDGIATNYSSKLTSNSNCVPILSLSSYTSLSYFEKIKVPKHCLTEYKNATNWSSGASVMEGEQKDYEYIINQLASATTMSTTIDCQIGDHLLACVVYRSTFTAPSGWTLLGTAPSITQGGFPQEMALYIKTAASTSETFEATQSDANRFYVCIYNLKNKTASLINALSTGGEFAERPASISFTKNTSNDLLFFFSENLAAVGFYQSIDVSGNYTFTDFSGEAGRLVLVYSNKAINTTFTLQRSLYQASSTYYNTIAVELV